MTFATSDGDDETTDDDARRRRREDAARERQEREEKRRRKQEERKFEVAGSAGGSRMGMDPPRARNDLDAALPPSRTRRRL
jgi:hypothetical protein